jgi:hypothetical protein
MAITKDEVEEIFMLDQKSFWEKIQKLKPDDLVMVLGFSYVFIHWTYADIGYSSYKRVVEDAKKEHVRMMNL